MSKDPLTMFDAGGLAAELAAHLVERRVMIDQVQQPGRDAEITDPARFVAFDLTGCAYQVTVQARPDLDGGLAGL